MERVTITAHPVLVERVNSHVRKQEYPTYTDFYNKAILNQLESDGDFEIRDLLNEALEKEEL